MAVAIDPGRLCGRGLVVVLRNVCPLRSRPMAYPAVKPGTESDHLGARNAAYHMPRLSPSPMHIGIITKGQLLCAGQEICNY